MSLYWKRKNWMLYVGRDVYRDINASIFFGCVPRVNPPEGEYRWRYSLDWSWDWLPIIRWRRSFSFVRIPQAATAIRTLKRSGE